MAGNGPSVGFSLVSDDGLIAVRRMLCAESVTKRYQAHTALDNLTLTVQPGEVFCLLGANGAGKTTTIDLFLNFVQPTINPGALTESRERCRDPCVGVATDRHGAAH
jgi:ABC-type uncharacterized transport system ATPase subunit